ncbi:mitochondrial carrier domain-containing protein [Apiospora arundinis]|uniref:Mitochondrial carrier domain-containing protein n=1 Tax=Apiospora arundinis TaxID=335852 RepID=A0ABR2IA39_9PEZI
MSGSTNRDVMLAGAAAAFTVDLLIYPLDTLKTRQQSQDFLQTFADPAKKTKAPSKQLFRGLYQGIGIVIVATLPAAGTFFTTYEAAKTFLGHHVGPAKEGDRPGKWLSLPQPLVHSAASAFAEMASCVVLTPAEVIKQNAQMVQRQQGAPSSGGAISGSSSMKALRQLVGGAGTGRKLLSGYTAMVARNLPFTAIQFPIFEHVRALMWKKGQAGKEEVSLWRTGWVTGTSAGLAGSFAAVVTTPMDVVKTRMMLMAGDGGEKSQQKGENQQSVPTETKQAAKARNARGGLAVARQVLRERGVPGLFRGAVLRAAWTAVGSGLYLGMYEVSKVWLTRGRAGEEDSSFP